MNSTLTTKEDFSRFGKTFQESLCQLILQDRPFADQIGEVLTPSFFELRYLQVFSTKIYEYKEKYKLHPTCDILLSVLRSDLNGENEAVAQQTRDFFARLMAKGTDVDGIEYIKETSLDFCKKQKLKEAILKSINLLNGSSFEEIKTLIDGALKLGNDNDFGYEYFQDFETRYVPRYRKPVSTGWLKMDELTQGGLGKGELGVVVAPTGAGKSMALVHLGAEAVSNGYSVIHYTLELQDTVVAKRYDSCITEIPLSELDSRKNEVLDIVKNIEGELIVKEYPTKSASTRTLASHLEKIRMHGKKIDMIIVDYGDLLRPVERRKEKRNELESIYEELRGLAQEYKCPIWTASQTNRSGLNEEVITMESISEAFSKCFVSDLIMTLSRTIEDKNTNSGRIFVAKNRNGADGIVIPIFMDTSYVKIRILPKGEAVEEGTSAKSLKEKNIELRKKYINKRRERK
ncbi:DnaB-like helicase C-terminal domain-containing protein [Luminiphilus sp.]|nr:DnaB-like helicase C-terminal domain-containing protein [Luminiphilus sp.]